MKEYKYFHHRPFTLKDNPLPKYPNNKDKVFLEQVTFCYRETVPGKEFLVAYAVCNSHDNFSRRIGRAISHGRLLAGDCYVVKVGATVNPVLSIIGWAMNKRIISNL